MDTPHSEDYETLYENVNCEHLRFTLAQSSAETAHALLSRAVHVGYVVFICMALLLLASDFTAACMLLLMGMVALPVVFRWRRFPPLVTRQRRALEAFHSSTSAMTRYIRAGGPARMNTMVLDFRVQDLTLERVLPLRFPPTASAIEHQAVLDQHGENTMALLDELTARRDEP